MARQNYLRDKEYFMLTAILAAQRSKDPKTQVGACIVDNENRIVGIGYNSSTKDFCDEDLPWDKPEKHLYVVHAEENAILNKNIANINGAKIYVTLFPCNKCAQLIKQSGIKEVIFCCDKDNEKDYNIASKKILEGIALTKYVLKTKKISFTFDDTEKISAEISKRSTDDISQEGSQYCSLQLEDL
ncbi:deoxycytidylate deaminase-like [Condylostylus longicornis]|uniref:deoxycytidylate deaminase-like n=1 Tax=Condylostylus longicornis TaxID=2530218 RepID=UPI00244E37F6|nr:deoxycytidylate deaminase-like [Condylostylus longicornis]